MSTALVVFQWSTSQMRAITAQHSTTLTFLIARRYSMYLNWSTFDSLDQSVIAADRISKGKISRLVKAWGRQSFSHSVVLPILGADLAAKPQLRLVRSFYGTHSDLCQHQTPRRCFAPLVMLLSTALISILNPLWATRRHSLTSFANTIQRTPQSSITSLLPHNAFIQMPQTILCLTEPSSLMLSGCNSTITIVDCKASLQIRLCRRTSTLIDGMRGHIKLPWIPTWGSMSAYLLVQTQQEVDMNRYLIWHLSSTMPQHLAALVASWCGMPAKHIPILVLSPALPPLWRASHQPRVYSLPSHPLWHQFPQGAK